MDGRTDDKMDGLRKEVDYRDDLHSIPGFSTGAEGVQGQEVLEGGHSA